MEQEKNVRCYAAPMEGITGYVYRNAHHHYFGGVEKYFTPFLTPKPKRGFNSREKNDILPEHNRDIPVVPQILTNRSEDFIKVAGKLAELGYPEVNLNLGCPSGTVVAKGKGSGFLADREGLLAFFEDIFSEKIFSEGEMRLSVKTRLGMNDPEEARELMQIYSQFPLSEVIIHARVREDYYKKPVNREAFGEILPLCEQPLCYNGDIFNEKDFQIFREKFPTVKTVMVGRGLIADPELPEQISGQVSGQKKDGADTRDFRRWKEFLTEVCAGYEEIMSGEKNTLFKMKELWSHMILSFPGREKYGKKIKKAKNLAEYKAIVQSLFHEV